MGTVALACALFLAACGEAADPSARVVVRDSGGIVLVDNRVLSADLPTWRITDQPVLDIGGDESDTTQQLYSVAGVARLSDGRIAIPEDGNLRVRFYDSDGVWLSDAGRAGDGPGEFRDIGRPYLVEGDSIVVYDIRLRRFTLLAPDGRYVRSWPLEQPLADDAVTPALFLAGKEWLARPGFTFSASTETAIHRRMIPYLRFAFDGTYIDSVGRFPGAETYVYSDDGQSLATVLPFLRVAQLTAAGDGGFWFGPADRYGIERRAADGRLMFVVRGVDVDVAMPRARLDAWMDRTLDEVDGDSRQLFGRVLASLPPVDSVPAHSAIRVDDADNLWVRDFVWPDEDIVVWRIFDPDGAITARIELPASLTIDQIGPDWILGRWTDELGIEHVRLYGLERPVSGP